MTGSTHIHRHRHTQTHTDTDTQKSTHEQKVNVHVGGWAGKESTNEMVGGLIQKQNGRAEEKRSSKRNAHSPATAKVLCLLCLHGRVKPKTM